MFADLERSLNASRGLSAIAKFLVSRWDQKYVCSQRLREKIVWNKRLVLPFTRKFSH